MPAAHLLIRIAPSIAGCIMYYGDQCCASHGRLVTLHAFRLPIFVFRLVLSFTASLLHRFTASTLLASEPFADPGDEFVDAGDEVGCAEGRRNEQQDNR